MQKNILSKNKRTIKKKHCNVKIYSIEKEHAQAHSSNMTNSRVCVWTHSPQVCLRDHYSAGTGCPAICWTGNGW